MKETNFDPETLREVFTYLYRCWVQKYLDEVPEKLALSDEDGILFSKSFAMYYHTRSIDQSLASELCSRATVPTFFLSPSIPSGFTGTTGWEDSEPAPYPFDRVLELVRKNWMWLGKHHERGLSKRQAYETNEGGQFCMWKSRNTIRLLLDPSKGIRYGYAIVRNSPHDLFFHKSKSCKEEGVIIGRGKYKRCHQRVEEKSSANLDLIYETGEVSLLHFTLAGAGYKVFPRQSPEREFETFT